MIVCPFCGLATESPHEAQGACIAALHAEISRVRQIVARMRYDEPPAGPPLPISGVPPTQKTRSS
jgi:hypothetical protein